MFTCYCKHKTVQRSDWLEVSLFLCSDIAACSRLTVYIPIINNFMFSLILFIPWWSPFLASSIWLLREASFTFWLRHIGGRIIFSIPFSPSSFRQSDKSQQQTPCFSCENALMSCSIPENRFQCSAFVVVHFQLRVLNVFLTRLCTKWCTDHPFCTKKLGNKPYRR